MFSKTKDKSLDDPSTTIKRRKILKRKVFLKNIYTDYYKRIQHTLNPQNKKGIIVELGSGAGFIKEIIPSIVTSDILKIPSNDMQFSATQMPFKNRSVNAFVMIDVFHHIDNVEVFLKEANRCLKKNGQIIMIEPSGTPFGRFIFTYFHHEPFDAKASWSFHSTGSLSDSNQALAWIVFARDRKKFKRKFSQLSLISIKPHTPLRFILSGGFSRPQLLPNFCYPIILAIENFLSPLNSLFGLFYTIEIVKLS